MSRQRGFTLVELLVVIAIIALLMSILMPALGRVRKQAKMVMCQANLKQWALSFSMYVDTYEGSFPRGWCGDGYTGFSTPEEHANSYWMQALRPYYGNAHDLRCCPLAMIPGTRAGGGMYGGALLDSTFSAWGTAGDPTELDRIGEPFSGWSYFTVGDYGSYGWNGWCGDPPPDVDPKLTQDHPVIWNWRKASVKGTGNIPLITANQWIDGWPRHDDSPPKLRGQPWGESGNQNMARFFQDRHDGSVNAAFLDWSVKRLGLKQLYDIKWHRTFDLNADKPVWEEEAPWAKNVKDYD
jgi:prepilin-type N-terminal cleavage/methylation domain-containing protein/prepilin-type processing-associated H-X9-DG protein